MASRELSQELILLQRLEKNQCGRASSSYCFSPFCRRAFLGRKNRAEAKREVCSRFRVSNPFHWYSKPLLQIVRKSRRNIPDSSGFFPLTLSLRASQFAPLTAHGKFRLFVKDETDPFTIGWVAFEASLAQANNDPSEYGQGASGYGKRFGAGLANETSAGFFGTFLFPTVLHQDPRYHRLGTGSLTKRLGHALIRPVLTHKDSGGPAFNWSGILGSIAASGLSNAYYPEKDRGLGPTFSRVVMSLPFGDD